jgi:tripartite-type tricarboxylate transporter receptor subunit TctC
LNYVVNFKDTTLVGEFTMAKSFALILFFLVSLASPLKIGAAEHPYFHGKTISLQVGAPAGGRQDRIARTMAKYLTKYIPGNPAFLIQNKAGGQGIPAMLALSIGPTDGSFMSTVISSYLEAPYFGAPGATYEPRNFVYVGGPSTGKQRNVLFFHQRAGIKTLDDLKGREVTLGSQGVGSRSYLYSRLITEVLELKVRWVLGYDTLQLNVALEQGEVQGRVNDAASMMTDKPEWFSNREIVALLAMTLPAELPPVKHPSFEKILSIMQFAKTDAQKSIIRKINSTGRLGGALAFPPGTPETIRRIMEEALLKVGKDAAFRKDWEDLVLEGHAFEQMFNGKEIVEEVMAYTDWRPEIMSIYKRLAHEAPR